MHTFGTRAVVVVVVLAAASARGQDWSNAGGNAARNGETAEILPLRADSIWSVRHSSIIAWQPVIEGSRVFMVRQTGFPPETTASPVAAMNLDAGAELWTMNIPAFAGDRTTWIAGVNGGQAYAGRSGNGASVSAQLHCLDASTGSTLWQCTDRIDAGAYDGVVFADAFDDAFVASFEGAGRTPGHTADFDRDGFGTGFDYEAFIRAFEASCL